MQPGDQIRVRKESGFLEVPLRHYEEWFSPWRGEEINLIEIGIANGSSLHVWQNYFKKARIVGIDINPRCARFANERVCIEIGSQDDPVFLQQVCTRYPPTIIINAGTGCWCSGVLRRFAPGCPRRRIL